jgi:hypothetical protein
MEHKNKMPVTTRGRKSVAALLVPDVAGPVQYPDAPYDLTDEESDEWRAIVSSMQPDHFSPSNFPVLTQLCRHVCNARRISQLISACLKAKKFCQEEYSGLLRLQATESFAIQRLSRSLRLVQQARFDKRNPKLRPKLTVKNPWDDEE